MPTVNLPQLPQQLPKTQQDWQQVLNVFQVWSQVVGQGTPWVDATLLNGWANHGGQFTPAGFCLRADRVFCRGVVSGGTVTDGTVLLTIPYPPAHEVITVAEANSNGTGYLPVRLDVDTSGNVVLYNAGTFTGGNFVSLDNLSFSLLP